MKAPSERASPEKSFSFFCDEKDQGTRLDQYVSSRNLGLSRSQAKRLIETGAILLNAKQAKPSSRLRAGDIVSGKIPSPQPTSLVGEDLSLKIIYEDASILIVDKPAGMVVHPAHGNPSGTLVNALLYHCKDLRGIGGELRPGIVHRLDKGTSGVMVVAKDDQAYDHLSRQFKNRTVKKVYLAIVAGKMDRSVGTIDFAIGRHPGERKRMSTHAKRSRPALTEWKVIEKFDCATMLEVFPKTGRTHQIRVHLSSIGHPLLGDPVYGRSGRPGSIPYPELRQYLKSISRQALHALRLGFFHPRSGEWMEFESPIPADIEGILQLLRSRRDGGEPPGNVYQEIK